MGPRAGRDLAPGTHKSLQEGVGRRLKSGVAGTRGSSPHHSAAQRCKGPLAQSELGTRGRLPAPSPDGHLAPPRHRPFPGPDPSLCKRRSSKGTLPNAAYLEP